MELPTPPVRPVRRQPPPGSLKYRAILEAAEEIFGARGFKKTGVDEIAVRAGVSRPLVYRYFRGKKELFEVVVEGVVAEWCETIVAEAARRTPSAAHSLRLVVGASLEFAWRRPVLRGLLARESQLMLAGYSDVLERGTRTLQAVLVELLERGVREGDVRTDLDVSRMAEVIAEVCVRFGDRLVAGELDGRDPRMTETIVETLSFGVVARRREAG